MQADTDPQFFHGHAVRLEDMQDDRLAAYVRFLKTLPDGRAVASYHRHEVHAALEETPDQPNKDLTTERRSSLKEILKLAPRREP